MLKNKSNHCRFKSDPWRILGVYQPSFPFSVLGPILHFYQATYLGKFQGEGQLWPPSTRRDCQSSAYSSGTLSWPATRLRDCWATANAGQNVHAVFGGGKRTIERVLQNWGCTNRGQKNRPKKKKQFLGTEVPRNFSDQCSLDFACFLCLFSGRRAKSSQELFSSELFFLILGGFSPSELKERRNGRAGKQSSKDPKHLRHGQQQIVQKPGTRLPRKFKLGVLQKGPPFRGPRR